MEIECKAEAVSIRDLENPDWLIDELSNPNAYIQDWLEIDHGDNVGNTEVSRERRSVSDRVLLHQARGQT